MSKTKKSTIEVQGAAIAIVSSSDYDFISLTDMAKKFGDDSLIYNWMRNRNTLELIGIWEQIHNPDFKGLEFETFRKQAGLNSFSLTPRKWIDATGAILVAIPAIKTYFKAYATSDAVRGIIESGHYTDLATNPYFSTGDFRAVPAKYRALIPN